MSPAPEDGAPADEGATTDAELLRGRAVKRIAAFARGRGLHTQLLELEAAFPHIFDLAGARAELAGEAKPWLPTEPSQAAVRKAFRKASMLVHPDRMATRDLSVQVEAEEVLKVLTLAHSDGDGWFKAVGGAAAEWQTTAVVPHDAKQGSEPPRGYEYNEPPLEKGASGGADLRDQLFGRRCSNLGAEPAAAKATRAAAAAAAKADAGGGNPFAEGEPTATAAEDGGGGGGNPFADGEHAPAAEDGGGGGEGGGGGGGGGGGSGNPFADGGAAAPPAPAGGGGAGGGPNPFSPSFESSTRRPAHNPFNIGDEAGGGGGGGGGCGDPWAEGGAAASGAAAGAGVESSSAAAAASRGPWGDGALPGGAPVQAGRRSFREAWDGSTVQVESPPPGRHGQNSGAAAPPMTEAPPSHRGMPLQSGWLLKQSRRHKSVRGARRRG